MKIQLSVVKGPHEGLSFEFDRHDTFLVGRGPKAHFRLPKEDRYFSRIHFMVELNPPKCRILDLNSSNGTFVNKQKIQIADLHDGDVIKGGKTLLRVSIEGDIKESTTEGEVIELSAITIFPASADSEKDRYSTNETTSADQEALLPADYQQRVSQHDQPIPGFKLVQKLGEGGMGAVYQAIRERDGKVLAIKTILPQTATSPRDRALFLREAEILGNLKHRNIVAFEEMGLAAEMLYFAMEYVPGCDAGKLINRQKPLGIQRACQIMCQLLDALEYAHNKGFVHRDIKPGNILVTEQSGKEQVKVADFGLARLYQSSKMSGLTMTNQIGGTPQFMPPEQITDYRNVGPAADQYSVAATLYHLLTAKFIFNFKRISDPSDLAKQLLMILEEKPVPIQSRRPDIPDRLDLIIQRGLAKEPDNRFENVAEMKQALMEYA